MKVVVPILVVLAGVWLASLWWEETEPADHVSASFVEPPEMELQGQAVLESAQGRDGERHSQISTEIAPASPTLDAGSVESSEDRSGWDRARKAQLVRNAHAAFRGAASSADVIGLTSWETALARQCAITILREEGAVQYEPEVVTNGQPGFRATTDIPRASVVVSDGGKFIIHKGRFPVLEFARARARRATDDPLSVAPLTEAQIREYDEFVQTALRALGVQ